MTDTSYVIFAIDDKGRLWNGGIYESEYFMKERFTYLKKNFKDMKWRITEIRPMAMKENVYTLDSPDGEFYGSNIL